MIIGSKNKPGTCAMPIPSPPARFTPSRGSIRLPFHIVTPAEAHLLLQVHDELVLEAPAAQAEAVGALVKRHMEGAAELSVPLVVEVGIGENWLAAKQ